MKGKKNIVVITDWFAPGYKAGGPIQSCVNFCMAMRGEYEICVITSDTDLNESEPYPTIESNKWNKTLIPSVNIYYFSKSQLRYRKLMTVINEAKPDFIYLNHMFSFWFVIVPLWMWWKGRIKSKMILCPRGALFDSAMHHKKSFVKKFFFLKIFRWLRVFKEIRFHATNENERTAIKRYFPTDKIIVANNFPNRIQTEFTGIKKRYGHINVIFIARILPIKNLLLAIQILSKVRVLVTFTIVGPIEDELYWQECQASIRHLPENIDIKYLGAKNNHELNPILKQNHLYLLPTRGENFGHSIFEAFLAGRPVLISDQTPWRNLTEQKIGWDISLDKIDDFVNTIEIAGNWEQEEFDEYAYLAWNFAKEFNGQSNEIRSYKELFS
ncbi:MAG: glycosyltransferase family 4 protein [Cyclobacteriaceae bacterium]